MPRQNTVAINPSTGYPVESLGDVYPVDADGRTAARFRREPFAAVAEPVLWIGITVAGNKEKESLEILKQGLKGLPGRIEIYGCEYVEDSDFIGNRMVELVKEYKKEKGS